MTAFRNRVLTVVKSISRGQVLTYAQVARRAGRPHAYSAVGNILNKNYDPAIPCHRVVRSDGMIGGYNRGSLQKTRKLQEEALPFTQRRTTPFLDKYLYTRNL